MFKSLFKNYLQKKSIILKIIGYYEIWLQSIWWGIENSDYMTKQVTKFDSNLINI